MSEFIAHNPMSSKPVTGTETERAVTDLYLFW